MKTIQVQQNHNTFAPKTSVYERQILAQKMHEKKLEEERRKLAEQKAKIEMQETTFCPQINSNYKPKDSFFERQQKHQDKILNRQKQIIEIKQEKDEDFDFKPKINPVSLYIVEQMQNQKRLDTRSRINQSLGISSNNQAHDKYVESQTNTGQAFFKVLESTQNPKISEFAQQLEYSTSVYDRLYKTKGSYKEHVQQSPQDNMTQSKFTKQQQMELQQLHIKHMMEYQKLHEQNRLKLIEASKISAEQRSNQNEKHKIKIEQLIQDRKKREEQGPTFRKQYKEVEYTYQPQISKESQKIMEQEQKGDILKRLEEDNTVRQIKINQLRQRQQDEELKECTFHPKIQPYAQQQIVSQQDFAQRQQEYIDRRRNLQKELMAKKKMQEENDIKYTQEHCNKFRAKQVPDQVYEQYLVKDKKDRIQMVIDLQNGDLKTASKLETIGNGNLVVGSNTVDSIHKFVQRIRNKQTGTGFYGQQNIQSFRE